MSAAVVICAYTLDRWDEIVSAAQSAAHQSPKPDDMLLVVDHNPELEALALSELVPIVPGLRVLANQHKKGLSGARNTALEAIDSDIVVFLDDDAAAQHGWLAALLAPYDDPAVVAVGGSAEPVWPTGAGRPATLPPARSGRGVLDWVVGCTYEGQPQQRASVRNLMGCNMSMRRSIALRAGGFSEDLGRIGRTPLGCEETELCIRMRTADPSAVIVFEPSAVVRHNVSRDRLEWRYLMRRGYAEGLSKATVADQVGQGAALETERGYVVHVLPRAFGRGLSGTVLPPPGTSRRASVLGSVAVVGCLLATASGYVRGSVSHRAGGAESDVRPALQTASAQGTR